LASVTAIDDDLDKRLRTLEEHQQREIAELDIYMDEAEFLTRSQMSDLPFPGSFERLLPPPPRKRQWQVNFQKEINMQEYIIEYVPDGCSMYQMVGL
jgi:hypothetical protein